MKLTLRRREFLLPPFAVQIVDDLAAGRARPKRQIVIDALVLLDATIKQQGDPTLLAQTIRAQYGAENNGS